MSDIDWTVLGLALRSKSSRKRLREQVDADLEDGKIQPSVAARRRNSLGAAAELASSPENLALLRAGSGADPDFVPEDDPERKLEVRRTPARREHRIELERISDTDRAKLGLPPLTGDERFANNLLGRAPYDSKVIDSLSDYDRQAIAKGYVPLVTE